MTGLSNVWMAKSGPGVGIELIQLPTKALAALSQGDLAAAQDATRIVLPPYLTTPECRGTWARRVKQVAEFPGDAPWVTRLIVDTRTNTAVGRAGFHGPPGARGMVEVGYSVDPDHRRRGHARAALAILLETAAAQRDVKTVRATISPGNTPSRCLVEQFGFKEVGEQWDDEDGLEIIYEVPARVSTLDP